MHCTEADFNPIQHLWEELEHGLQAAYYRSWIMDQSHSMTLI